MTFLHEDFLLDTPHAQELYHNHAAGCPIIDFHNHLDAAWIASDHRFTNLTEAWLGHDHYKWRVMRAHGISEDLITGAASDEDKFMAYARCVPHTVRNPIYHWTHLSLRRYFGINEVLNEVSAKPIYAEANRQLALSTGSTRGLLSKMMVQVVCTTDDPADDLSAHEQLRQDPTLSVCPTFRPDRYLSISSESFVESLQQLGQRVDREITDFGILAEVLVSRIGDFDELGCRASDHGLTRMPLGSFDRRTAEKAFVTALSGSVPESRQQEIYCYTLLQILCREYARRGWVQQFHLGPIRNNNSRLRARLGSDAGTDSIGDYPQAESLSGFLDALDRDELLAKTILFNSNPADNALFATMVANFNDGSIPGKMQHGSGWWFLDQLDGMRDQLNTLSQMGMISHFVGMVTDSRSVLSFPRHEYFRRLICQIFGRDVAAGLLPTDIPFLGSLIRDICYNNANRYFGFGLDDSPILQP